MDRLSNKVAIVTGAGSGTGMGAVTASLFASQGAKVVITDQQHAVEAMKQLVEQITKQGYTASYSVLDVTDAQSWDNAIQYTLTTYGKIDILVNNAGTLGPHGGWDQTSLQDTLQVMNVNFNSQFIGIKKMIPIMEKAGQGAIVNIGSIGSIIAFPDVSPAYAASKSACRMLSKSAAVDLAKRNIRVNAVLPGFIDTPMASHLTDDKQSASVLNNVIPLGRAGKAIEIANAVLFLASDQASYITGTELVVDGGYTAI
ncbi:SDR family NAD(P)-dependent oxidoreductase [Myroides sp. LJL119]